MSIFMGDKEVARLAGAAFAILELLGDLETLKSNPVALESFFTPLVVRPHLPAISARQALRDGALGALYYLNLVDMEGYHTHSARAFVQLNARGVAALDDWLARKTTVARATTS